MSLLDLINNLIKGDLAAVFANPNPPARPDRIVDPPAIMAAPDQPAPPASAPVQPTFRSKPIPNLEPPAPVQPTLRPKSIPNLGTPAQEGPASPPTASKTDDNRTAPAPATHPQAGSVGRSTTGQFSGDLKEAITTANSMSAEDEAFLREGVKKHQATIARLHQELKSLGSAAPSSAADLSRLEQQEREGWKQHEAAEKDEIGR